MNKLIALIAGGLLAVGATDLAAAHGHSPSSTVPVHGPGSSHNPIVYHPVHGPGSSHNPIVSATGTVVRDHRGPCGHYYHCWDPRHVDPTNASGGREISTSGGRYSDDGSSNRDHRSH